MGTETDDKYYQVTDKIKRDVKLNDPLMGTETLDVLCLYTSILIGGRVKLNDPLMGTETRIDWLFENNRGMWVLN